MAPKQQTFPDTSRESDFGISREVCVSSLFKFVCIYRPILPFTIIEWNFVLYILFFKWESKENTKKKLDSVIDKCDGTYCLLDFILFVAYKDKRISSRSDVCMYLCVWVYACVCADVTFSNLCKHTNLWW